MFASSGSTSRLLGGLAILAFVEFTPNPIVKASARPPAQSSPPCLHAAQILELVRSLSSPPAANDSYSHVINLAFGGGPQNGKALTAFEENRAFVYAAGGPTPGLVRRLIILKPSVLVLDDEVTPGSQDPACLDSDGAPEISAGQVRVAEGDNEIVWETPPPQKATYGITRAGSYVVKASSPAGAGATPFLQVFYVAKQGRTKPAVPATLVADQGPWRLTAPLENRVFRLWLPPASDGAGEIAIASSDGKVRVDRQPLPSGILPHGPEGNRLLEKWDSDYRGTKPPAWDIGRPADELQKLVREGTIRKCRAVDLGCGSGTDAIFLASKGFDVTGVDVSPAALGLAAEKARKAGVSVRWILADVTAPPNIGPFDFIYDRGCYHNVRDQNLEAYIETLRRFSHDGTKLLVLSARRDAQSPAGSSGVTEEELRFDFSSFLRVEWLREIVLESNEAGVHAPGWSALMQRDATP